MNALASTQLDLTALTLPQLAAEAASGDVTREQIDRELERRGATAPLRHPRQQSTEQRHGLDARQLAAGEREEPDA